MRRAYVGRHLPITEDLRGARYDVIQKMHIAGPSETRELQWIDWIANVELKT